MSSLRLIQFTDLHLFGTEAGRLRGVNTYETLMATLDRARRDHWPPDALLVTGDLVQDDIAGYALFRRVFGALKLPVYCLPGNHDDAQALKRSLASAPFETCAHVDRDGWRIVLLDSSVRGSARGHLTAESLASLEASLGTADGRHVLVCLHHHPVQMHSRWLDTVGLDNAPDFWRIVDASRSVRGVLWGHVHQSFEGMRGNVRLLATPSTCAQFVPRGVDFEIDSQPPAYRVLALSADGSIETQIVWVSSLAESRTPVPSAA